MHDPMVVAFDIPSPIPHRRHFGRQIRVAPRWAVVVSRRTNDANRGECTYPWWRPRGYTLHLAGHAYGLRTLATIWHVEPGGADSGEVCRRYYRAADGEVVYDGSWRWHVHHWQVQVSGMQALRRRLLTRCAWCNGRHRRSDPVNNSHSWDGDREPWWRGERGLFHRDCSSAETAHATCICAVPVLSHRDYGTCAVCGGRRGYGQTAARRAGAAVLKQCPTGQRPTRALLDQANAARQVFA